MQLPLRGMHQGRQAGVEQGSDEQHAHPTQKPRAHAAKRRTIHTALGQGDVRDGCCVEHLSLVMHKEARDNFIWLGYSYLWRFISGTICG